MSNVRDINTRETISTGYKIVSLETTEFHGIELSFLPEETQVMKAPNTYNSEVYTAIALPLDTVEEVSAIFEGVEEEELENLESSAEKKGFLNNLREDLTGIFQITKVESEDTLPLLEVKKELL